MPDPETFTLKGTPLFCHRCGKDRFTRNPIPYHLSLFDENQGKARPDDINRDLVMLRCAACGFEHRYRKAFVAPAEEPPGRIKMDGFETRQ